MTRAYASQYVTWLLLIYRSLLQKRPIILSILLICAMCHMCYELLMHMRHKTWHDSLICVTWLAHMCDMTHSYVWHDTRDTDARVTVYMYIYTYIFSHIYIYKYTYRYSHMYTLMNESRDIWMSHVTHMNGSCHTYEWVMSHIWMGHVTHMHESCHTYSWHTCNTLQHTATRCNTLQHIPDTHAIHCNTLQRAATHCNTFLTHMCRGHATISLCVCVC